MMKKALSLLLVAVLAFSLVACGGGNSNPPAEGSGTAAPDGSGSGDGAATATGSAPDYRGAAGEISVCLASAPETLDPQLNSSSDGGSYLCHLNEGLFRYNWDGNGVEYGQAESHTVSEDGLVWTFTLRDDAKWSDGQAVVADDFIYAWTRLVDPAIASPYGVDMGQYMKNGGAIAVGEAELDTLGIRAIDEKTIEITLEGPCGFFDEILAFPTYMPVRQDMIDAHGDRWIREPSTYLTNGAFKMESFSPDENLIVVPNEHYYDVDKIVPERITFQFLADENAYLNAFQGGEILYAKRYPQEEKAMVEAMGCAGLSPLLGTYYMNFNNQEAPFDDPNVRKAFVLAIDREYIASSVMNGLVIPAEAYVGPGYPDADANKDFREEGSAYFAVADYEANKEAARQALADAGYPNGEGFPRVEYLYNVGTGHQTIAEACQNMWKEVLGVQVDLANQDWNVFQETRRSGNFQMARDGWIADYNDPMAMLTIFITGGGNNSSYYSNPRFDELLNLSMSTTDRDVRAKAMHDAEDILMGEDWGTCPIYYYADPILVSPQLKDAVFLPIGYQFFFQAYWE